MNILLLLSRSLSFENGFILYNGFPPIENTVTNWCDDFSSSRTSIEDDIRGTGFPQDLNVQKSSRVLSRHGTNIEF